MLQVEAVRKDFGSVTAVRDLSFTLERGQTLGLIGPNGAGKTTTMRMIVGIYVPDAGRIQWDGKRVDGSMRRRFGYMPEERGLYGRMKVRDQIVFFGRLHGLTEPAISQRTDHWIKQLELREYADRTCAELSKGNQQKVQVACAAVHEPELLIMDEPFSGLDPVNADMLSATLADLKSRGTTLILSSHQMYQLEQICDSFCIITTGAARAVGTLSELRAAWPTRVIRVEPGTKESQAILEALPKSRVLPSENGALLYQVPSDTELPGLLRSLVSAGEVTRFEAIEPSLHDIYIHAIGEV